MSDSLTIRTNNIPRFTLDWHDLTDKERAEFDYLDTDDRRDSATFARYKGHVYDLGDLMRIDARVAPHPQRPGWENWHGYASDSFFSGVLVRYVGNDGDSVVLATYYS